MMRAKVPDSVWRELSGFVARELGLYFPPARYLDLERGLRGAGMELGLLDETTCIGKLLSEPPSQTLIRVLARHLTIGETYFFRDAPLLSALAESILPALIRSRRGRDQQIRIWSAGCASGEETYSLAILLHQLLPDLAQWRVSILGTDVNERSLQTAVAGIYSDWSFRSMPAALKARYFNRQADGRYAVADLIKKMVSFDFLNLAKDGNPSLGTGLTAVDVIFCQNVLMYFSPSQAQAVLGRLHSALIDGGWLALSPSEYEPALVAQFQSIVFPGSTFYTKHGASSAGTNVDADVPPYTVGLPLDTPDEHHLGGTDLVLPLSLNRVTARRGGPEQKLDGTLTEFGRRACSLRAWALANQGRLEEALKWCDRWIDCAKTDEQSHYLRAMVLLEKGATCEARTSLQRVIYLNPCMVMAHVALGNLARNNGDEVESTRHFANALSSLGRYRPHDLIPQSGGLSAATLAQAMASAASSDQLEVMP